MVEIGGDFLIFGTYGILYLFKGFVQSLTLVLLVMAVSHFIEGRKKGFAMGIILFCFFAYPRYLFTGSDIEFLKGVLQSFFAAIVFSF